MKKLLAILFTVLIALPAFSQLNFGIKAGLSTTSITMADAKSITSGGTTYTIDKLKGANYGIHFGVFGRLNISKLYIQPELLFATRSNEYNLSKVNSLVDSISVVQNFNKLDIPVMIGLKFGAVRINAGPVGSLRLSSPKDLVNDPDFKAMYASMTFGYQAGVGIDILKKLTIDLRYEGSLKKYQNQIENAAGTKFNLDDRPNAFLVSVGIMF
jgi:opacity protein-like surface antigen